MATTHDAGSGDTAPPRDTRLYVWSRFAAANSSFRTFGSVRGAIVTWAYRIMIGHCYLITFFAAIIAFFWNFASRA